MSILHLAPWSCPSFVFFLREGETMMLRRLGFWWEDNLWWETMTQVLEGGGRRHQGLHADYSRGCLRSSGIVWTNKLDSRGQYPIMHQYPVWATLPCWTPCTCPLPRWLATWASFFSLAILFYWPEVTVGESVVFDGELKLFHRT